MGAVGFEAISESLTDDELDKIAPALDMLVDAMARQAPSESDDCGKDGRRDKRCA